MSRSREHAPLIAFVAAAAATLTAHPQPDRPVFRTGVQVVEVDARVFDRSGRFVTDLTSGDFELLEDGVPQPLQTVALVDGATLSGTREEPADPLVPETGRAPMNSRQTWVFLFDTNHLTSGAGFDRARAAIEEFIRNRFRDGDLGGVVAESRMTNNRLTSEREELVAAVRTVKPPTGARSRQMDRRDADGGAVGDDADAERRATMMAAVPILEERAAMSTLNVVNTLASGLARMPGPKTIVFVSDGFPVARIERTLQSIVGHTARAGARVYAIDVRGVNRDAGAADVDRGPAGDAKPNLNPRSDPQADGMNTLAVDTGGLMIRNVNNIGAALDTIAADTNRYYVLAYQPTNAVFDGTFRAIQVRVKRPDVRVRARRGYLALEPSRIVVPQPVPTSAVATPEPPVAGDRPAGETDERPAVEAATAAPVATASATVNSPTSTGPVSAVRLRPDATERIREIAGGDLATSDQLAHRGWDAYQRGDVETAIGFFAQAAARPDVRPWVVYTLGLSHAALGRPGEAAIAWERVRSAAPAFRSVYLDLADTYMLTSDLTKALSVLRDAETRWRDDAEVQNAIGVIHVRRGALNDAIASFSRAAAAAPNEPLTYWNLGRAFELRFVRGRRYVSSQRRWTANDEDRRNAMLNYRRCVDLGGPYAGEAAQALGKLEWIKK